jgi:hypothetical protein
VVRRGVVRRGIRRTEPECVFQVRGVRRERVFGDLLGDFQRFGEGRLKAFELPVLPFHTVGLAL